MPTIPIEEQQAIMERLKQLITLLGVSQSRFAARLGISPANMSKHLSGKLPITPGLVNRIALDYGISRQWLTTGEDVPFGKGEADHLKHIISGQAVTPPVNRGVPVYDIDVTAGFGPLERIFTADRITGYIDLPQLTNASEERIVRVSGNSMEPMIANGSYVAIRQVQSDTIFWGQAYVVILEDYRMVKIIRKHRDSSMVILHSENPNYDDLEIKRSDIIGMYLVDAVINYQTT